MTKRDILAVALRVVGVYFAIQGVMTAPTVCSVPWFLPLVFFPSNEVAISARVLPAAVLVVSTVYVGITAVLLTKADALAQKLGKEGGSIPAVGAADWEWPVFELVLKIIGVVCIMVGLADLAGELARWPNWPMHPEGPFVVAGLRPRAVEAGLLLVAGAYLLTGARRLVVFVFRSPG